MGQTQRQQPVMKVLAVGGKEARAAWLRESSMETSLL
jgi:hypothetical protein